MNSTSEIAELRLPPEPGSVAQARTFAVEAAGVEGEEIAELLRLLVSELATNAVLHARTEFVVRVRPHGTTVRVEVEDRSADLPRRKAYGPAAVVGRGLVLVEAIADRWGIRQVPGGKVVWAELEVDDRG